MVATALGTELGRQLGTTLGWPPDLVALFGKVLGIFAGGSVFTADYYVVDVSGKVSDWIDWLDPTHTLHQGNSGNQVAIPAPHAALQGSRAYLANVAEFYDSTRGASASKYRSDGTGVTEVFVTVGDSDGANRRVLAANFDRAQSTTRVGASLYHQATSASLIVARGDQPTPTTRTIAATLVSSWTDGVAYCTRWKYAEARTPTEYTARRNGASIGAGDSAAAPSPSNPSQTLRVMASPESGIDQFAGAYAFYGTVPRITTDAEDATVNAFLTAKYGVAA